MAKQVKATTLSEHRYAETFQAFVARSSEYEAMLQALSRTAQDLPTNFSCLDIGAGTGSLIRDWSQLSNAPSYYFALEPNETFIPSLKMEVENLNLCGSILCESFHSSFRLPEGNETERFDMILFSHSLYYMSDPGACIEHAMNWLSEHGIVLIFHIGPFGLFNLFHQYDKILNRDKPVLGHSHGLSSYDISRDLDRKGLRTVTDVNNASIDLTGMFDEGFEKERDEVISFMLQVEFAELHASVKDEVIAYLRKLCVEDDAGRLVLYHPAVSIKLGLSNPK
uniref:Methyltransferase domain-containing protein n=1 Tax=Pseudictyota dubia TaxID=2749911 RepID=A0A7R9ZBY5_9STRA|mmetsp:Transcript_38929/g.71917  ORF Transcript_38929/g.71917 Transcript_38929/m.71917 type:complete len:281 (+) Transcript_38929:147-989(+)|eukprot:CAMPEP_0197461024 /NCGR_PEP_ID=MMETSP1175-20131217/55427_1 /TAXON_ID=1003142 /ORGANISM="Triceratium dubium, Strain CCMP147" /LENGTH=280 /DNA_ID=CAMNT_0042996219 /DNA_START=129 /DNA_END=971 /DNA_ORIENTATION=+